MTDASSHFKYPYMPTEGRIRYVDENNEYIQVAKEHAQKFSLDRTMPNASVIVEKGEVIGIGANGSSYHEIHGCERVRLGSGTGKDYEKCEGCHPKNHSENKAITSAFSNSSKQGNLDEAELYLWGHWWCCEACWKTMLRNNIKTVYLLTNSSVLFNKDATDNVVGKQFKI